MKTSDVSLMLHIDRVRLANRRSLSLCARYDTVSTREARWVWITDGYEYVPVRAK